MPSQIFTITGLHCESCVQSVTQRLLAHEVITAAKVTPHPPQVTLDAARALAAADINAWLAPLERFSVSNGPGQPDPSAAEQPSWRPIILVFVWLLSVTAAVQFAAGGFVLHSAMSVFMGGFFMAFSFFKFLDLRGFAASYRRYDLVAKVWAPWALAWPFIEFALGLAYLAHIQPFTVNLVTAVLMAVSLAGVLRAVLSKQQIRCACLGAGFNLPVGTVTVIEDGLMLLMAVVMLW